MKILILDDDLDRHANFKKRLIGHEVTHVETSQACIDKLKDNGPWDYCFLDHDLGGEVFVKSGKNTGYEVAEWLRDNQNKMPGNVIVHSLNPAGALNMISAIPNARHVPFAWTKVNISHENHLE